MKTLIIIADLGRIRCIRLRAAGDDPVEKEHLAEEQEVWLHEPTTRAEVATDESGRFARGGRVDQKNAMSYGEEHNLEQELERRALQELAHRICELITEEGRPRWILAAPQAILPRLEKALPGECRKSLAETVGGDLTKEPLADLEERFLTEA